MTMTTGAEYLSIFTLCPNDEALTGLREVNSVLKQAGNTGPASDGMYELKVHCVNFR